MVSFVRLEDLDRQIEALRQQQMRAAAQPAQTTGQKIGGGITQLGLGLAQGLAHRQREAAAEEQRAAFLEYLSAAPLDDHQREQAAMIAQVGGVEMALPLLQAAMQPKAPIKLGADETLLDPRTHQPLATGQPKLSADARTMADMGYDPANPEHQRAFFEMRRQPAATVNVTPGETRLAQHDADRVAQQIPAELRAIREEQEQIDTMSRMLDEGLQTGQWAMLAARARDFGLPVRGDGIEAFQAAARQQMLAKVKLLPGPASDKDVAIIEQTAGNAGRTPEANRAVFEMQERLLSRRAELLQLEEQYFEERGSLRGFNAHAREWQQSNPTFPEAARGDERAVPGLMEQAAGRIRSSGRAPTRPAGGAFADDDEALLRKYGQ